MMTMDWMAGPAIGSLLHVHYHELISSTILPFLTFYSYRFIFLDKISMPSR